MKILSGYKTYIVGGVTLLYAIGIKMGCWPHVAEIDLGLGGTYAITIRAALTRLCQQISDQVEGNGAIAASAARKLPLILAFACLSLGLTSCSSVPTRAQIAASPATTTGLDVASLATQATDVYNHVKDGNIDYAWAIAAGLNAYQTLIHTKTDVQNIVAMFGGDATLAENLARLFGQSTSPPASTTAALAKGVSVSAATSG